MAALTSDEQMMLLATVFAVAWSSAPVTQHSSRRVAPSPSPAIWRQSQTVTLLSARQKAVKSAPGAVISALPARPFARMATMSFVDVSPSTLTMLNVSCTSPERAACSMAGLTAQSVVRKTSMVARFGWIMPEPLAMPPMVQVLPPAVNCTAISLRCVSVVMMPSAAWSEWSPSAAASCGRPARMGARSSGWPITPVDATMTSCGAMCSADAVSALISSATAAPSALQVLALPLLQITACALPSARCAFVTVRGAPLTRLDV